MAGWGGVVAQGLAGFVSGAGKGGLDDIVERQKIEAQKLRDEALAKLAQQTHASNAASDLKMKNEQFPTTLAQAVETQSALLPGEVAKAKAVRDLTPVIVPSGSTAIDHEGNVIYEGPARPLSDEQRELIQARIEDMKSRAEDRKESLAIRRDAAGKKDEKSDKVGQGDLPKWTTDKQDPNLAIDSNTGWTREKVEGHGGKPASSGIFGLGAKEAIPAQPVTYIYRDAEGEVASPAEFYAKYPKSKGEKEPVKAGEVTGSISSPSSSVPTGWMPIGRSPDGRIVYRTPDGKQKVL